MRSYKRYTRRKRLLKQIAVVALSPNRVFTKEQIYQHIYEEAESEVNNRIYGLIKNLRKKIEENPCPKIFCGKNVKYASKNI